MRVCSRIGLAPYLRLRRRADHRDLAQPLHRPPAGTCCQVCTSTARFSTSRRARPASSSGRESPRSGEYALGVETPNSGRLRANREAEMRPKPGALGIDGKDRHRCVENIQHRLAQSAWAGRLIRGVSRLFARLLNSGCPVAKSPFGAGLSPKGNAQRCAHG